MKAGREAGTVTHRGYVQVRFNNVTYLGHRLAWFFITGKFPENVIDHINGDKSDNRACNLRDVSPSANNENRTVAKRRSSSGLLGVTWLKHKKRWRANIMVEGKAIHIGTFKTAEEAHEAYMREKGKVHLWFARKYGAHV